MSYTESKLLADMVSLELLLLSGGVLLLIVGGVFFALAMLVAGFIKRRKNAIARKLRTEIGSESAARSDPENRFAP